nr:hypothetical protein [Tanacetum cinerariifolium]
VPGFAGEGGEVVVGVVGYEGVEQKTRKIGVTGRVRNKEAGEVTRNIYRAMHPYSSVENPKIHSCHGSIFMIPEK